ncbi:MAG: hypothetical protein AAFZ52_10790 [Bacteroidota bacterium]
MKEDIITPEVTDVVVAVIPREGDGSGDIWDIFVVNLRDDPMDNVLITSQGYGELEGRDKTTTVLRHFHQQVAPHAAVKVEPIQAELFGIQNEYWISFNDGPDMLDKRFVFKAGTISTGALETVPVLDKPGVMIR